MKTPICDFIEKYAQNDNLRLHMPGHKGVGGKEYKHDITEIFGADSLYEANGIIAESEKLASDLFGAHTFYSTEGSSLSIRAMLYLVCLYAKEKAEKPLVLAGRNAHKSFVSAAALLDLDVEWLTSDVGSYLSCKISAEDVEARLDSLETLPSAVYITSPDYLGNITDIEGIARICHERGVLLLVDNAHGAYLAFLEESMHPIALGADMCCDSAHKTLPALTGAAYLHVSGNAPKEFSENAKNALALFGSTSPSYLILESLDRANKYLAEEFRGELKSFVDSVTELKKALVGIGYTMIGNEPMKLTVSAKEYGYTGDEMAEYLVGEGIIPEFSDPDFLVLMPSPMLGYEALERILAAFKNLKKSDRILTTPKCFSLPARAMSIRDAALSPSEWISVDDAEGRILASVTVGCPPAVPIAVCGEIIDRGAIDCFKYYGIEKYSVVKSK